MTKLRRPIEGPVLVVGAYGYRNVGDEAILSGLLARLVGQSVTVVSRSPAETAASHGVRAISIRQSVAALARHRTVIIGGGGLFGRDMGRVGRLLPAFGLLAIALRRSVIVEGVDVDDRLSPSARLLTPPLLRAASRVSVRDRASAAILEGWGATPSVLPDLSQWMEPADAQAGRAAVEQAGADLERPLIGLALTAVNRPLADLVLQAVEAAMRELPEAQFCFVPMSRHPSVPDHNDLNLARELAARRRELLILDAPLSPAVMLSAFRPMSAVVAMRYHAMLFAERAGVPLLPIPYAEKTYRWLADHGVAPVDPTPRALTRRLSAALAEARPQRRRHLQAAS
jgi:polysaccharide pyruvyl transferase WcaK-like protein